MLEWLETEIKYWLLVIEENCNLCFSLLRFWILSFLQENSEEEQIWREYYLMSRWFKNSHIQRPRNAISITAGAKTSWELGCGFSAHFPKCLSPHSWGKSSFLGSGAHFGFRPFVRYKSRGFAVWTWVLSAWIKLICWVVLVSEQACSAVLTSELARMESHTNDVWPFQGTFLWLAGICVFSDSS